MTIHLHHDYQVPSSSPSHRGAGQARPWLNSGQRHICQQVSWSLSSSSLSSSKSSSSGYWLIIVTAISQAISHFWQQKMSNHVANKENKMFVAKRKRKTWHYLFNGHVPFCVADLWDTVAYFANISKQQGYSWCNSRISPGSVSARESVIAVGDRCWSNHQVKMKNMNGN